MAAFMNERSFMEECTTLVAATLEDGGDYGAVIKEIREYFNIGSLVEGARTAKAALAELAGKGNVRANTMLEFLGAGIKVNIAKPQRGVLLIE